MGKKITDYLLYRWRFVLGYGVIGLTIASLLLLAGVFVPGGITQQEMASTVASHNLSLTSISSFDPATIINLPYNLLQLASTSIFGVTAFSIKLPSLLLAALSVFGMILLLQMWFRRNVAVLTTLLVVAAGQFLFVAQNGTPSIVYVFWSVWLLVSAMMVSRNAKHLGLWKIGLFGTAALSLYTPLSIYILIALASAVAFHPHLRFLVRKLLKNRLKVAIASAVALLMITPLVYAIVQDPSIGLTLLGIPAVMPDISANLMTLLQQNFNFASPNGGLIMTPIFGLGSMILIVLGVVQLFTTNYTARSYIIAAWIILLLPVFAINTQYTTIAFVPSMLLMAMGISTLLRSWYELFPRNPYARFAGLIPLTILIGGIFVAGVARYTYSYTYTPTIAINFTHDVQLLNKQLRDVDRGQTTVVVTRDELAFYRIVAKQYTNTVVTSGEPANTAKTIIVSSAAYSSSDTNPPNKIITDGKLKQADRFYIYKTDQK